MIAPTRLALATLSAAAFNAAIAVLAVGGVVLRNRKSWRH